MFIFLMSIPVPLSLVFPYTTLFRSWSRGSSRSSRVFHRTASHFSCARHRVCGAEDFWACNPGQPWWRKPELATDLRSEEHTSELQSLRHLVCRLLLEKKDKPIVLV